MNEQRAEEADEALPPRFERANWARQSYLDQLDSHKLKNASRHISKLNMGETKDDIHVCIMCLRAIMNNKVRISRLILRLVTTDTDR